MLAPRSPTTPDQRDHRLVTRALVEHAEHARAIERATDTRRLIQAGTTAYSDLMVAAGVWKRST